MKANFALKLSFTGIRLLHRAAGGWRFVGEVSLDDPDLDGALAALRRTALELEPSGLRTKLILPDTQIRYLTIDTTTTPGGDIVAMAERALDGATPYPVRDLAYDVSPDGTRTHIAAVARETLTEAEAFAVEHRLAPISFVAVPEGDAFLGEPFFGAAEHASQFLAAGERVEPDGVAVVELGPLEWPAGPVVDVTEDTPVASEDPANRAGTMPLMSSWAAAETPLEDAASSEPTMDASKVGFGEPEDAAPFAPPQRSVGFASRRRPGQDTAPKLGGVTRRFDPVSPADGATEAAGDLPADSDNQGEPAPGASPIDDDVPEPPAAIVNAFLNRGRSKAPVHDPRDVTPAKPAETPGDPPPRPADATADQEQAEDAVGLPASAYAPDRTPPEIRPLRVPPPQSERERMTVFGARQSDTGGAAVAGGNPRFVGLAMTAVLIVFLVGVAAWAAVFIDEGIARFFGTPDEPVAAQDSATDAETGSTAATGGSAGQADLPTDALPGAADDGPAERDLQTASLDPGEAPGDATDADARAESEAPTPFDPAEAEARYAVTGIWTVPPEVPQAPALGDIDDLYVTSIDPPGDTVDAVALQPETGFTSEAAPVPLASPAPPGTEFELDDRGLVIPTPDGAMTPDGIMVYTGPPPVVPPDTPERAAVQPEESDASVRQDLLQFRPRTRPTDLVENTERRQLGGLSRSELAAYRPKERPEAVKQAEEEDETPTAQAVASSLRPSDRPGNFSRIVARAQERVRTPAREEAAPQQAAAATSRAVAPSIPSRSSVTQEATVRNAVNLRRINLMGVYGSPSNRRALIRLSNGRYKKVKVGDRIDGGRVSAIGDSELSYVKGNRNIVLRMPRT